MSKHEEADLILKLYELRREDTMRKARDWYFREFNPKTYAEYNEVIMGEHSGHLRMVISYWEMAAALVNGGAISQELFASTNSEYLGVFSKLEPVLGEIRSAYGPQFAASLEKLVDSMPDGRKQIATLRERMKAIMEQVAARQARTAKQS